MSVSAVLNARLDWPGSSSLVPDVDSLCCQGLHIPLPLFTSGKSDARPVLAGERKNAQQGKDIGPKFSARQQKKNSL